MLRHWLPLALLVLGACRASPTAQPITERPVLANQGPTTTTPSASSPHLHDETPAGLAAATLPLDERRQSELGLAPPGPVDASALPGLTADQWADPEVVAARFLLVQTNGAAGEDPATIAGRRDPYTSPHLARELELAGAGAASRGQLSETSTVFHGEVVGLATGERSSTTATVAATVRRWHTSTEPATPARISFYVLRLVFDAPANRWLVVDLQIT